MHQPMQSPTICAPSNGDGNAGQEGLLVIGPVVLVELPLATLHINTGRRGGGHHSGEEGRQVQACVRPYSSELSLLSSCILTGPSDDVEVEMAKPPMKPAEGHIMYWYREMEDELYLILELGDKLNHDKS
uniref:Uncharacterized protein n=1 Tax=Arundo donax TaxID=35708 RepID=A0A0A8ZQ61_ARUDO